MYPSLLNAIICDGEMVKCDMSNHKTKTLPQEGSSFMRYSTPDKTLTQRLIKRGHCYTLTCHMHTPSLSMLYAMYVWDVMSAQLLQKSGQVSSGARRRKTKQKKEQLLHHPYLYFITLYAIQRGISIHLSNYIC